MAKSDSQRNDDAGASSGLKMGNGGENRRSASLESAKLGGDAIGRALQAHFRELAAEPIPDRFLELLASLENKEKI